MTLFKISFTYDEYIEAIASFCTMNVVMIPILGMSSIIAEEKEKGTLRSLIVFNVKPVEYLLGVSITIFFAIMVSSIFFIIIIPSEIVNVKKYLLFCAAGAVVSVLIGAIIGLITENQIKVGAIAAPIAMVLGMLPVFAEANKWLKGFTSLLYSDILSKLISQNSSFVTLKEILILLSNILIVFLLFYLIYRNKGLEN